MGTLLAGFYLLRVYDMNVATYVAAAINFAVGGAGLVARSEDGRDSRVWTQSPDPRSRNPEIPASGARRRSRNRVCGDRIVRVLCAGCAGHLDASPQPVVRRVHLHVLVDSRRFPDRPRHRQQPRIDHREERRAAARRPRMVSAAQRGRDGVERVHAVGVAPVLAHQHVDHHAASGTTFSSISSGPSGPCCPARSCGAQVSRSRLLRSRGKGRTQGGWSAVCMPSNTVGAIVGSVVASLILVYWFGSQRAQQVLMIVSGMSGLLLLAPAELSSAPR